MKFNRSCCIGGLCYTQRQQHDRNVHWTHTASSRHAKHRNSTELSKHIWTLKDDNIKHFISWHILSSYSLYNRSSKRCNLCLKEKFLIICRPKLSTLRKLNELVVMCRPLLLKMGYISFLMFSVSLGVALVNASLLSW